MAINKNDAAYKAVKKYLDKRAKEDELFAKAYAKDGKSMDECMKFIIGEARKRGNAVMMTDDEVYGLAVHYYDEDDVKVEEASGAVTVGTSVGDELAERYHQRKDAAHIGDEKKPEPKDETLTKAEAAKPKKKATAKKNMNLIRQAV